MTAGRTRLPIVALTLGDVAGIGPEVAVKAALSDAVRRCCVPVLVGDEQVVRRTLGFLNLSASARSIDDMSEFGEQVSVAAIPCWNPSKLELSSVQPGELSGLAGRAAYEWLVAATREALNQNIDAIVTAPLNKAALKAGALDYPGHTEILAHECGVSDYAMMLYLPAGQIVRGPHGLGVAHVTLHTSIASVPKLLTREGITEKIRLVDGFLRRVGCAAPRVGVCALNPHAGEEGLFGDEESRLIAPAVQAAQRSGVNAMGPLPADTLLKRAVAGEFDGVAAMYHDQGHIALKLIGFNQAVNVTLGLPIVRTSPSHGTAFDIAGQGIADSSGMEQAILVAVQLAATRTRDPV